MNANARRRLAEDLRAGLSGGGGAEANGRPPWTFKRLFSCALEHLQVMIWSGKHATPAPYTRSQIDALCAACGCREPAELPEWIKPYVRPFDDAGEDREHDWFLFRTHEPSQDFEREWRTLSTCTVEELERIIAGKAPDQAMPDWPG